MQSAHRAVRLEGCSFVRSLGLHRMDDRHRNDHFEWSTPCVHHESIAWQCDVRACGVVSVSVVWMEWAAVSGGRCVCVARPVLECHVVDVPCRLDVSIPPHRSAVQCT